MKDPIICPDPLDRSKAFEPEPDWVQSFDYEGMDTMALEEIYPDAPVIGTTEGFQVAQGGIGNCGSIAEIAAYAESTGGTYKLEDGIYPTTPSPSGQYWVRFAQGSKLCWVKIDSKVPQYTSNSRVKCCRPKSASVGLWPSLLEKAKATIYGGAYSMILNKKNPDYLKYQKEFSGWFPTTGELVSEFSRAKQIIDRGGYAIYAWPKQVDDNGDEVKVPGIVTGHAFTSTDAAIAIDSDGTEHQLIHVENPWGGGKDYQNPYAQDSDFWDGISNRDRFLRESEFGGSWWMSWDEFLTLQDKAQIKFHDPLPNPEMPFLVDYTFKFDGSNATEGKWPGLKKLEAACVKPIPLQLEEAGKLSVKISWISKEDLSRSNYHVYFVLGQGPSNEVKKSRKGWWGKPMIDSLELEAGTYELYPATICQNEDRGEVRILIQGDVNFVA